eukprot:SAG11_NODE_10025_length_862_cov_1.010485_1_plen_148_part_01
MFSVTHVAIGVLGAGAACAALQAVGDENSCFAGDLASDAGGANACDRNSAKKLRRPAPSKVRRRRKAKTSKGKTVKLGKTQDFPDRTWALHTKISQSEMPMNADASPPVLSKSKPGPNKEPDSALQTRRREFQSALLSLAALGPPGDL